MACDIKNVAKIIPATFAWALLLFSTGLFFVYPCWYLTKTYSIAIPIVQAVITFFVLSNFTLATFLNPGVIPKAHSDEWKEMEIEPLYIDVEIKSVKVRLKWCMTCHFFRPPRCTHCGVCDSCIEVFDHHCPWLNNCIGLRNYRFFYFFLLWLSVHKISILGLCILYIRDHLNALHAIPTVITISIIAIIVVFIIPILGLTAYHTALIFRGRTTNEHMTGKFYDVANPFSLGGCRNLVHILCTSLHPSFQGQSKKRTVQIRPSEYKLRSNVSQSDPNYFVHSFGHMLTPSEASLLSKNQRLEYQNIILDKKIRYLNATQGIPNDIPYTIVRGSRAVTPPVCKQDGYRFHHLRRSLPAHSRVHSSSQHIAVHHNLSLPPSDRGDERDYFNGYPSKSTPQIPQQPLYHSREYVTNAYHQRTDPTLYIPTKIKSEENFLRACDTFCLDNKAFDKMQELTISSMKHLTSKTCMHHSSMSNTPTDSGSDYNCHTILPVSDTVASLLPTVDDGLGEDISARLAHFKGRRPLSFVKAIEMSDAIDSKDPTRLSTLSTHVVYDVDSNGETSSSKREVSYEICV